MKKIAQALATYAKRLYQKAVTEPLVVRAAVAAVVNVLIVSGLVEAPFAEDVDQVVEGALLAVANLGLLLSARKLVTPTS
jgi:hypothetical protein